MKRESERADEIALEIQKFQGTNVFCSVRKRTSTWTCVMLIALMSILYDRPTRAHTLSLYVYLYIRAIVFVYSFLFTRNTRDLYSLFTRTVAQNSISRQHGENDKLRARCSLYLSFRFKPLRSSAFFLVYMMLSTSSLSTLKT